MGRIGVEGAQEYILLAVRYPEEATHEVQHLGDSLVVRERAWIVASSSSEMCRVSIRSLRPGSPTPILLLHLPPPP
jgi:hypothetical protein